MVLTVLNCSNIGIVDSDSAQDVFMLPCVGRSFRTGHCYVHCYEQKDTREFIKMADAVFGALV